MTLKAKLRLVLYANDVIVAESDNAALWQEVLAAIHAPADEKPSINQAGGAKKTTGATETGRTSDLGPLAKLAGELKVTEDVLEGACGPTNSAPLLHLDNHHWEALKKGTPARGPKAISPFVLAATLLVLWKKYAQLGEATSKEVHAVLNTIHLEERNSARAITNCEWLQARSGIIVLNPSQTSKALALARAFCLKKSPYEV